MNLYSFYKKMYGVEKGIEGSKLFRNTSGYSRIFTKHIIRNYYSRLKIDDELRYVIEENDLSDWEIKKIYEAKKRKVDIGETHIEKWLDNYFELKRGSTLRSKDSSFDEKMDSFNSMRDSGKELNLRDSSKSSEYEIY